MVTSITVLALSMGVGVSAFMAYLVFKGVRTKIKRGKVHVSTPKVKGRAVIRDKRFGSARVIGYEPMGIGLSQAALSMLTWDNHIIKQVYFANEIEPENTIQAIAGASTPMWKVKGSYSPDSPADVNELEEQERQQENIEMKKEQIVQKAKTKIAVNEAVNFPDKLDEMIKEITKKPQHEGMRFVK